jgi:hypothetical protein
VVHWEHALRGREQQNRSDADTLEADRARLRYVARTGLRGPTAMTPVAIAALAVGAVAIGRISIWHATIKRLSIEQLEVKRRNVTELEIAGDPRRAV